MGPCQRTFLNTRLWLRIGEEWPSLIQCVGFWLSPHAVWLNRRRGQVDKRNGAVTTLQRVCTFIAVDVVIPALLHRCASSTPAAAVPAGVLVAVVPLERRRDGGAGATTMVMVLWLLLRHALRVGVRLVWLELRPVRRAALKAGRKVFGIHGTIWLHWLRLPCAPILRGVLRWVRSGVRIVRRLVMVVVHGSWSERESD